MRLIKIRTPELNNTKRYYIPAYCGKKCVGHVYLYLIGDPTHQKNGGHYAYVDDLFIDDWARGLGGGRTLMKALLCIAKRERCYKIVANSHRKRKAARALYASMGFIRHGTEFRLDL